MGLLVVDSTVPGSPADGVLEPGDVLVCVQGEVVSHFLQLEELLDGAVGQTIELQLERGGKQLVVQLPVTNLHDVTPATMLELAGGSVHALSYQQARNNRCGRGHIVAEYSCTSTMSALSSTHVRTLPYKLATGPTDASHAQPLSMLGMACALSCPHQYLSMHLTPYSLRTLAVTCRAGLLWTKCMWQSQAMCWAVQQSPRWPSSRSWQAHPPPT